MQFLSQVAIGDIIHKVRIHSHALIHTRTHACIVDHHCLHGGCLLVWCLHKCGNRDSSFGKKTGFAIYRLQVCVSPLAECFFWYGSWASPSLQTSAWIRIAIVKNVGPILGIRVKITPQLLKIHPSLLAKPSFGRWCVNWLRLTLCQPGAMILTRTWSSLGRNWWKTMLNQAAFSYTNRQVFSFWARLMREAHTHNKDCPHDHDEDPDPGYYSCESRLCYWTTPHPHSSSEPSVRTHRSVIIGPHKRWENDNRCYGLWRWHETVAIALLRNLPFVCHRPGWSIGISKSSWEWRHFALEGCHSTL